MILCGKMSYGMNICLDCLTQLAISFSNYCEKNNIKLKHSPYFLIRKEFRLRPLAQLIIMYNKVMRDIIYSSLTADISIYHLLQHTRENIENYFYFNRPISYIYSPISEEIAEVMQHRLFERIIYKMKKEK